MTQDSTSPDANLSGNRAAGELLLFRILPIIGISIFVAYRAVAVLRAIPSPVPFSETDLLLVAAFVVFPWIGVVSGYRRVKSEVIASGASVSVLGAIQRFGYLTLAAGYLMTMFLLIEIAERLR